MISEQAKQGVEFIFIKAAKANLALGADDVVDILPITGVNVTEFPEPTIIVLTISSFLFRLLAIFHIDEANPELKEYFTKGSTDQSLVDVLSEIGNLCCGAVNRDLHNYVPYLGMSTPYALDSKCMSFVNELKPGFVGGYEITINNTIQMHASICFCEYQPIDFAVEMSAAEEDTGMLELF